MSHENRDPEKVHNLSRFFVENREIAWVALFATLVWGVYGYVIMPQRRDPDVPNKQAVVVVLGMERKPMVQTVLLQQFKTQVQALVVRAVLVFTVVSVLQG